MRTDFRRTLVLLAVLLLSLVAGMISSHLLTLHAAVLTAQQKEALKKSIWSSVCGGDRDGGEDDCQDVITSRYGYLNVPWYAPQLTRNGEGQITTGAWGWGRKAIPLAQLGLFYYMFMGLWFLLTGVPTRAARRWHLLPLVLSGVALAASLNLISVMAWRLEKWCPLCMILHAIDFFLLLAMILLWPKRRTEPSAQALEGGAGPQDEPMNLRLAAAALTAILGFCGASFMHREQQTQMTFVVQQYARLQKEYEDVGNDERVVFNAFLGTEPVSLPMREDAAALGPADAAHTLVLFSDLQCPHCKRFEQTFEREVRGLWNDQVRMVFRHYPLCSECNSSHPATLERPHGLHPQACLTAFAVEAARLQGGDEAFWKLHDLILENQEKLPQLGPEGLAQLAVGIGLDGDRLRADMDGPVVRQIIDRDVQDALASGVRSTPSAFLDGRYLTPLQRGSKVFWTRAATLLLGQQPSEKPQEAQPIDARE